MERILKSKKRSELFTVRKDELENVCERIFGTIYLKKKKFWGWSKMKFRYIEAYFNQIFIFKWKKRRRKRYKQKKIKLTKEHNLSGISSTLENGYSFTLIKGKKEKIKLYSKSSDGIYLLYNYIDRELKLIKSDIARSINL